MPRQVLKKIALSYMFFICFLLMPFRSMAADEEEVIKDHAGGAMAATGQLKGVGYATKLYNSSNGLPTSDANCILSTSDGYIWVGGYAGLMKYDGVSFERQDSTTGLTNANALLEDEKKRIWVGTNDNGILVYDNGVTTHKYTYLDGLKSSTMRSLAESIDGSVYAGSTNGISYVDSDMKLHLVDDSMLSDTYIMKLCSDKDGRIYGCNRVGEVFCIENGEIISYFSSDDLGIEMITTIFVDPYTQGYLYYGTTSDKLYYGRFGSKGMGLKRISVSPANDISWITEAADRIWVMSGSVVGYLDQKNRYITLNNLPLTSLIGSMIEDYEGNLWFSSTRQGIMKLVSNSFMDISERADAGSEVVNTTCTYNGALYVGTEKGLEIITSGNHRIENILTDELQGTRIRCIIKDDDNNLWIATYTKDKGLICYTRNRQILRFDEKSGFICNEVRSIVKRDDGSLLVSTNRGLAIIKDKEVVDTIGKEGDVTNTLFLTSAEGPNGEIYIGTDGDGIYIVDKDKKIRKLGRDDGLTSDVIMRIKRDKERGVYWVISSNALGYMKDEKIHIVEKFPYSNNYDIFFSKSGDAWVLASNGIYVANGQDMIDGKEFKYQFFDAASGLPSVPTGNSYSDIDDEGNLYISGRSGVSGVNIDDYMDREAYVKVYIKSITVDDKTINPEQDGTYIIPASRGRIQISASILNYTLINPRVKIYLEGAKDEGVTMYQSNMSALEYTSLPHGNYKLHVQLQSQATGNVYQDEIFNIKKEARLTEILAVRLLIILVGAAIVALVVWQVMRGTVIRRQYEQIRIAKDEAERANSAKSRFLANMSHEIRTPINTIMGMDEMIMRQEADGVPKEYYQSIMSYASDIKRASESLLGLINDVLDLSKIESGKVHLVEQEYSFEELLRSIIPMIRVRSNLKNLDFKVEVDEKLPQKLYGDDGKIKQVVLNLLTNAVKYTEEGGFTLKVERVWGNAESCRLRFSVTDTGIGVKPEDIDKLFSAFERVDENRNRSIQGTGLGLHISKQFAELMKGELRCESEYGNGSTFTFEVEQKVIDSSAIGVFNEDSGEVKVGPYIPEVYAPEGKVLVVDDDAMNRQVISGLLSRTGLQLTCATNGRECLDKLKEDTFHLVLLDHMMPVMDGLETIKEIRKDYPDLPVLMLTANAANSGNEFYKNHGFNGYLPKPINGSDLEKAIREYIPKDLLTEKIPDSVVVDNEMLVNDLGDMSWVKDIEDISVDEGITNCGSKDSFVSALTLFANTVSDNSEVIEKAYEEKDIKAFTIKVHALKSAARLIGAMDLSELAKKLEAAGNDNDIEFINEKTKILLEKYRGFKEKLKVLLEESSDDSDKELIPENDLKEAYEALKEFTEQMEYDGAIMVVEQVKKYKLPEKDKKVFDNIEHALKQFDWDKVENELKT